MSFKLNRFSEARQDQVEQLIAYAELLGLTGRDLVAIGGKMDREKSKVKKLANMEIIKGFECLPIGRDRFGREMSLDFRFKLKTSAGNYNFTNVDGWNIWEVHSLKTKMKIDHPVNMYEYELPKVSYQTRSRYAMLLDVASGKFLLNF